MRNLTTSDNISSIIKEIHSAFEIQNDYYVKSCEQIVVIGKLLLKAETLAKSDEDAIFIAEQLPFPSSTASKYKQIAKHPVLSNPSYLKQLPSSMSTLYEYSKVARDELIQGIKSGEITQDSTRKTANQFAQNNAKSNKGKRGAPVKTSSLVKFLSIQIDSTLTKNQQDELLKDLIELRKSYSLIQLKIFKDISEKYKTEMKESATQSFQKIIKELDPEVQNLSNLISYAISDCRKNNKKLSKKFKWRIRLVKELGLDSNQVITEGQIYKFARDNGVITRYTDISSIDPVAYVWGKVIDFCEGDKTALNKLRKFNESDRRKPNRRLTEAKKICSDIVLQLETL